MNKKRLLWAGIGNLVSIGFLSAIDMLAFDTTKYVVGLFVVGTFVAYHMIGYLNRLEQKTN